MNGPAHALPYRYKPIDTKDLLCLIDGAARPRRFQQQGDAGNI